GLRGGLDFGARAQRQAGVLVSGITWEIAAGNLQADAVALGEDLARLPEADGILVDAAGLDGRGILERFAERHSADAFADVDRAALRIDVGQRGGEVGV